MTTAANRDARLCVAHNGWISEISLEKRLVIAVIIETRQDEAKRSLISHEKVKTPSSIGRGSRGQVCEIRERRERIPVVLGLQEVELLLDTIAGVID